MYLYVYADFVLVEFVVYQNLVFLSYLVFIFNQIYIR